MENQSLKHRLKKRDFVFLGVLLLTAAAGLLWFLLGYQTLGNQVEITVDGNLYGTYSLNENQSISIISQGEAKNILEIKNGQADMIQADCPDKLCVHQAAVSHAGETIVCLPHKIVVTVVGEEAPALDSVVK